MVLCALDGMGTLPIPPLGRGHPRGDPKYGTQNGGR
jgi:hypothetical protein